MRNGANDSSEFAVHLPGKVAIPAGLDQAMQQGRLVLFVGAGASVDPHSSLPLFEGLTRDVLNLAGLSDTPAKDGRFDVQLGDLEDSVKGFNLHDAVRKVVGRPGSIPNRWHSALAGLFEYPATARVVTTNYDTHLETAIGPGAEVWNAPALPLGHSFRGVVHLHGGLDGPNEGFVVTDKEFGRAYLTEGWARRFVVRLFQDYHVLFVGYSHDDLVMQYVARGLPPEDEQRRFALVSQDEDLEKWRRLRIEPITYRPGTTDRYEPAVGALVEWGKRAWWSPLDHQKHIQHTVAGGPLLDPIEDSYLTRVLAHPARVRYFCDEARTKEWLGWATGKTAFARVFDREAELSPPELILAAWFAEAFVEPGVGNPLNVLAERGGEMSSGLAIAVARAIWRSTATSPGDHETWIALIASQNREQVGWYLNYLLEDCVLPKDKLTALTLLGVLLEPHPKLTPGIAWGHSPPHPSVEIEVKADGDHVGRYLSATIEPNIGDLSHELYCLSVELLQRYHRMHRMLGNASATWDPMSYMRSAIEPHAQDANNPAPFITVDLARVAAGELSRHRSPVEMANELLAEKVPLLRRLAVWVVTQATP